MPVLTADDDRALLHRFARSGDEAAFAALVARHGPLVLGVCRRVLRDPDAADDAFQAVFLVLARKADRVRAGASLGSYLFGIARRVSLAARRRQVRLRNAEIGLRIQEKSSPPPAEWDDLLRALDEELARLPDRLRAPVLECFLREKTQDEAAKALGWSLSTVRRRLTRAKALLRDRLSTRGVALSAVLAAGAVAGSANAAVPPLLAQTAVKVASVGRACGAVPAGIGAIANVGGTPMVLKAAIGVAAAGAIAAGVGIWFGPMAPPEPSVVDRPVVIAVPTPVEVAPAPRPFVPPAPAPVVVPPVPVPQPPESPAVPFQWVALRGRITLPNTPRPSTITATTDKEFCEKDGPLVDESLIVGRTGGVKNVVVWLRPDSSNRNEPFPRDRVYPFLAATPPVERVIDQPCCQFVPRITAARAGDMLVVRNSAKVAHNVNMSAGDENPHLVFNVNIPSAGDKRFGPVAAQRTPIPFKCDIHPWMKGFVRVFDHPYFAVTDDDGNFELRDAPAGNWRLVVWHEGGFHRGRDGVLGMPVELRGEQTDLPAIELQLPKP